MLRLNVLAVFVVFSSTASAEDWPQFRGPAAQGHSSEKNLPTRWDEKTNIAWKVPVAGEGWSSPVIFAGKIYLTTAVEDPAQANSPSLRTLAFDARTGKQLWDVEVFKQNPRRSGRIHRKNSHASPTPITDGKRVWVHFGTNGTACLTTEGKILWKNTELEYRPVHGSGGSPALVNGLLILSCDGSRNPFVVALDAATGKVRWKTPRPESKGKKFAFCTPLVIGNEVFLPGANWAAAYDIKTGKETWRVWHGGYSVIPRPVFGQGRLYFSSCYDRANLIAVKTGGKGDVSKTHIAWSTKTGAPHTPSTILVGEELYFVSDRGIASCVDARTGKVHWKERIRGNFSASPVFADGHLYFQTEAGVTIVLKAGQAFKEVARNDLKERSLASPAISNGAIYLRTRNHLWKIAR